MSLRPTDAPSRFNDWDADLTRTPGRTPLRSRSPVQGAGEAGFNAAARAADQTYDGDFGNTDRLRDDERGASQTAQNIQEAVSETVHDTAEKVDNQMERK